MNGSRIGLFREDLIPCGEGYEVVRIFLKTALAIVLSDISDSTSRLGTTTLSEESK